MLIIQYLCEGIEPTSKEETRKLRYRASHYVLIGNVLYKHGHSLLLLRCLNYEESDYVLREIHEGMCKNHSVRRSLSRKVLRQGYYQPSLTKDATQLYNRCNCCQRFANVNHQPLKELTPIFSLQPFAQQGVDIIGPLFLARAQLMYAIVAIDYFTKWVETKSLATITKAKTSGFIWRSIVCHFGIPYTLIKNNGRQFDNEKYQKMCSKLGIKWYFSTLVHPQANGQWEAANKVIKHYLKTKLDSHKGAQADKLRSMLQAHKMTSYSATRETTYFLAFRAEKVVPMKIGLLSH